MHKNIIFFLKPLILILLFISNLYAEKITIIPLKKPILNKEIAEKMITQGILKPKSKPIQNEPKEKYSKEIIKPKSKPVNKEKSVLAKETKAKQDKKNSSKIVENKTKKVEFLLPKSKPLVVKKTSSVQKTKSKFYSKKDYDIAKKSIQAIEKRQWTYALSISKKAKDKSIYNFIQWQHLLTSGNQASFYDYMTFIKRNENYPRINVI